MKIKKFNEEIDFQEDWTETDFNPKGLITVASIADDWEGIYFEDELVSDGHYYSDNMKSLINYLIKNNVQMGGYKFKTLNIFKNGQYEDFPSEDELDHIGMYRMPSSLTELVDNLTELGYEVRIGG